MALAQAEAQKKLNDALAEIERGVIVKERTDPIQAQHLRRWFDGKVLPVFASRTLAFDFAAARGQAEVAQHLGEPGGRLGNGVGRRECTRRMSFGTNARGHSQSRLDGAHRRVPADGNTPSRMPCSDKR